MLKALRRSTGLSVARDSSSAIRYAAARRLLVTDRYRTPASVVRRNAWILIGTIVVTFVAVRLALFASPDADLTLGPHNVHHLFTGQLLIALGGIPLAIFRGHTRHLDLALVVFGIGLALALDEWVYLIATDGSNASYLLPVSFWGGLIVVSLALTYAAALVVYRLRSRRSQRHDDTPGAAA
jgi:hypothetical protein